MVGKPFWDPKLLLSNLRIFHWMTITSDLLFSSNIFLLRIMLFFLSTIFRSSFMDDLPQYSKSKISKKENYTFGCVKCMNNINITFSIGIMKNMPTPISKGIENPDIEPPISAIKDNIAMKNNGAAISTPT